MFQRFCLLVNFVFILLLLYTNILNTVVFMVRKRKKKANDKPTPHPLHPLGY